jgi:hypothetical protein
VNCFSPSETTRRGNHFLNRDSQTAHGRVRTAGFEPAISCARSTRIPRLSHVLNQEHPAGVEPALPPWQGSRLPLHHGRLWCFQIVKDRKSTGWDSNPRRRITGAESSPLDDQCFLSQVGPLGLEPRPARLRAGDAAANTSIPCCVVILFSTSFLTMAPTMLPQAHTAFQTE